MVSVESHWPLLGPQGLSLVSLLRSKPRSWESSEMRVLVYLWVQTTSCIWMSFKGAGSHKFPKKSIQMSFVVCDTWHQGLFLLEPEAGVWGCRQNGDPALALEWSGKPWEDSRAGPGEEPSCSLRNLPIKREAISCAWDSEVREESKTFKMLVNGLHSTYFQLVTHRRGWGWWEEWLLVRNCKHLQLGTPKYMNLHMGCVPHTLDIHKWAACTVWQPQ